MYSVGNLGGILYNKETPILRFKFVKGVLRECEAFTDNMNLMPFDIVRHGLWEGVVEFFSDRCTPDTRQGIHETLKETPMQYYHPERMLRYCHAQCIHDNYWIEQDDDNTCWIGSPIEGVGVKPNKDWHNIYTSLKFK